MTASNVASARRWGSRAVVHRSPNQLVAEPVPVAVLHDQRDVDGPVQLARPLPPEPGPQPTRALHRLMAAVRAPVAISRVGIGDVANEPGSQLGEHGGHG
jgi:hypothetical protein